MFMYLAVWFDGESKHYVQCVSQHDVEDVIREERAKGNKVPIYCFKYEFVDSEMIIR